MRKLVILLLVGTLSGLSGCASSRNVSVFEKVGWNWLVQYSYLQPRDDGAYHQILVQMYDDGRMEYIRHLDPPLASSGAAWRRELKKFPNEMAEIKRKLETVLSASGGNLREQNEDSEFDASIIIRTADELVEAWADDRFGGDPREQAEKVFKNLRLLDDQTHKKIQKVFKQLNAEAEKLPWKWG